MAAGALGPNNRLTGARVLDAFAGTGALSLEALSRGAEAAVAFEIDPSARRALSRNAATFGEQARMAIRAVDATAPPPADRPCGIVFLDPPYRTDLAGSALLALLSARWIGPETLVVHEHDRRQAAEEPAGFRLLDSRYYGHTAISLLVANSD